MNYPINDPYFRVEVLSKTERPNLLSYLAMHQCYSENVILDEVSKLSQLSEKELGDRVVKNCLKFGHWSVCYDKETEVLTNEGFKLWEEITQDTMLYAVDPKTGVGQYEKPLGLVKQHYKGEMFFIDHNRVNLLVTPDHKMFVKTRINKKGVYSDLYPIRAFDLYGRQFKMSVKNYLSANSRTPINFTNEELSIIGFWLGDGVVCKNKKKKHISFHLKVKRKIDFLAQLNCYWHRKDYWQYDNNLLCDFLHTYCLDATGNKMLPDCLLNIPYEQFLYLSDGLAQSDGGHRKSRLQYDYSTSHKPLADKLYVLYTLNGLAVKIETRHHSKKNDNWRDNYRLVIHPNTDFRIEKYHQSKVTYEGNVYCAKVSTGALVVRRQGLSIISGNCEHPHITFCVSGFPHNVMAQATRHRLLSFSVQSQRYTGQRIQKLALKYEDTALGPDEDWLEKAEALFYLRPVGEYLDREGRKYLYSQEDRYGDSCYLSQFVLDYRDRLDQGYAPEHARDFLPQNIRQDFVVTFNARSLLHFCDLRLPKDAQLEIRTMAQMLFEKFKEWMPEVAQWYEKNRYEKSKLAP